MEKTYKHTLRALFLTALPVEYQAVQTHLYALQEVVHKDSIYEQSIFATLTGSCEVGLVQVAPGNSTAAVEAERAITWFSPDILCFVGVAGGIKDVQLGDVVVATDVYHYETGKADSTFFQRPKMGRSSYDLLQRAQAEARKHDWLRFLKGTPPRQVPRIFIQPLAAGEKVITSTRSATWKHIRANYEDAVAVEMEGYGFLQAAYANQPMSALVIRGISDLIENKREADAANSQEIAARHASAFAFQILASLIDHQGEHSSPVVPQEDPWEISPLTSFARREKNQSIQNHGTFSGFVIQENNGIQHFHQNVTLSPKEEHTDGNTYLQRGYTALLHGNYTTARQYLDEATRFLDEKRFPAEAAQARFLQTLALLHGERPRRTVFQTFQRIKELLESAVALLPAYSYLYTFALIMHDYAPKGYPELHDKAEKLLFQARGAPLTSQDRENVALLGHCQPHLLQDMQSWRG